MDDSAQRAALDDTLRALAAAKRRALLANLALIAATPPLDDNALFARQALPIGALPSKRPTTRKEKKAANDRRRRNKAERQRRKAGRRSR